MSTSSETPAAKRTTGGIPRQQQPWPGRTDAMDPVPDHGETSYIGCAKLVDCVALITGGDSGIGRATAIAFAREGADVAISYLDEDDDAADTARIVRECDRRALVLPGDLREPTACQRVVQRTVEELGRLDILVLNAAYQKECAIDELDVVQIERTFRTNILAPLHIVQAALPHLHDGASILITGSVVAFEGHERLVDYACTKAALHNLTLSLSKALASRGIRVNCVAPGPVWTPLIPATLDRDHVARFGEDTRFGRPAQPAEIAPSFVFLAAHSGSFYTGEVLAPTGRATSR
jgi:NAD(P)-dependent dehydrogenase (short-subunit alcohol dehydrogenase family)